jgi:hexosaminidase
MQNTEIVARRITRPVLLSLTALMLTTVNTISAAPQYPVHVIPEPQKIEVLTANFTITPTTAIVIGCGSTFREKFAAEQIRDEIRQLSSLTLKIINEGKTPLPANSIFLSCDSASIHVRDAGLSFSPDMFREGYGLYVAPRRIVIAAQTSHGLFYGAMTLCQLLTIDGHKVIVPGVRIHDWPLMSYRGISDDMSRGQSSTMENLQRIIRTMARYKYNVYSPYIEDIFTFTKYPSIWKNRGALTHEQVRELEDYADQFHIDIIPIFETLGHFENILIKPEFVKYAEFPGAQVLNTTSEEAYAFLQDLIDDIAPAFRSQYFNMAADETYDVGLGASKERVAKSDLATVHAEHYQRVLQMLQKHNKKVMLYADVILDYPEIFEKITKDFILVDWQYHPSFSYPSIEKITKTGFPFISSPAVWNYLNPFPYYANALPDIQSVARNGFIAGAKGLSVSNWGDNGGETLRELIWYGNAWGAECAWSPLTSDIGKFNDKFFRDFYGISGDEMASIYAILSDPYNQEYWNEFWRHPFVPMKDDFYTSTLPQRITSLQSTIPLVRRLLDAAAGVVTRNIDHIGYLKFIVHLHEVFIKKVTVALDVKHIVSGSPSQSEIDTAVARCTDICDELKKLKEEFNTAWLKNYRPDNLDLLLRRYDYQISYWQEKIIELQAGNRDANPLIESSMIYAPGSNPGRRDPVQVKKAYFRKTFMLDSTVQSALLQLIGDTWARVYVNDSLAGEVYGRRSLSLTVEFERVKLIDILPLVKSGKNIVAVQVQNFDKYGSAGVNIYTEITSKGGIQKILSDSTWKVTEKEHPRWTSVSFNDASWPYVSVKETSMTIIRPNFSIRRPSWIER